MRLQDALTESAVLNEVRVLGPVTVRVLTQSTGLSEGVVRRALKRMEKRGVIESSNYQRRARVYMPTEWRQEP